MIILGVLTLAAAAALAVWYRPCRGEGAKLCGVSAVMGLAALAAGDAGALFVAFETLLTAVVLTCTLFSLHREKLARERAQKRRQAKNAPAARLIVLRGAAPGGRGCA